MNPTAFLARVATLLPTLPPSPIRSLIAALLVNADASALFDQVARIYLVEGMLGLPATGKTPLPALKKQHEEEVRDFPPELFNPRDTGVYKSFYAAVRQAIHNPQRAEEAAQNIFAGITPGKGASTDPLFYAVGKSIRSRGNKDVTISGIKGAVSNYTARKARDYGKLRKSPTEGAAGLDSPLGADGGRTLADILADTTDYTLLQAMFDTPAGAETLRRLSETVEAELPSEGQKMVWQAILRQPDLIGSRSESVAGAELARALNSKTYEITPQRAGQLWRAVLEAVRKVAALNPDLLSELEDTQLVKRMLDPRNLGKYAAKRLARRYAILVANEGSPEADFGALSEDADPTSHDQNLASTYEKVAAASIPVTLKKKISLKDGTVIEVGTRGVLRFNEQNNRQVIVDFDTRPNTKLSVANLFDYFGRPFTKVPSMRTLSQMGEGLSKSVTGKTVEPDGYGPDGSPSWLIVLGMI